MADMDGSQMPCEGMVSNRQREGIEFRGSSGGVV